MSPGDENLPLGSEGWTKGKGLYLQKDKVIAHVEATSPQLTRRFASYMRLRSRLSSRS